MVDAVKSDILKDLTYDAVMEFEYLAQCYNESLRREPPAGMTFPHTVMQDTTLGGVRVRAG